MAVAQAVVPENDDKEDDKRDTIGEEELTKEYVIAQLKANFPETDIDKIKASLHDMDSTKVLIGITGASCTGKSSFINNMLGMKEGDDGAAEIGDVETTMTPKVYTHPKIGILQFVDLPGYQTISIKMSDEYIKKYHAEGLHFVLLFYGTTLSSEDIEMIKRLQELKKKFALVRTRADDMERRQPHGYRELIEQVKIKAKNGLRKSGIEGQIQVFVISNVDPKIGEYDNLFDFIVSHLPAIQKEAFILHVDGITAHIIAEKRKALQRRAWKLAACIGATAAACTAVHISGISILVNLTVLGKELHLYLDTYGLHALMRGEISDKYIAKTVFQIKTLGFDEFIRRNIQDVPPLVSSEMIQYACSILPNIGVLISGASSFHYYLNFFLDINQRLAEEAKILLKTEFYRKM